MKRTAIKRSRRWTGDDATRRFWHDQVTRGGCVMDGPHDGRVVGHHVIPKAKLRSAGLGGVGVIFDCRNGIALCERHHAQHHNWRERLPVELIPASVYEFAAEYGVEHLLEREHPEVVWPG